MSLPPVAPSGPGPSIPSGWRAAASAGPVQVNFSSTYQAPPSTVANSAGTSPSHHAAPISANRGDHVAARPSGHRASSPVPWLWLVLAIAGVIVLVAFALRWREPAPGLGPQRAAGQQRRRPRPWGIWRTQRRCLRRRPRLRQLMVNEGLPTRRLSMAPRQDRRPSLPGVEAGAPGDATPLPEGAMLQMIGHVRLVRLPQADEAPAVPPAVPTEVVSRPAGPVSAAPPGPPPSPMSPAAPEAQPSDAGTKGPLAADVSQDPPTPARRGHGAPGAGRPAADSSVWPKRRLGPRPPRPAAARRWQQRAPGDRQTPPHHRRWSRGRG